MKNKFILFYLISTIIISQKFDLSMDIYSEVFDRNSATFVITPHPEKTILPFHFASMFEVGFLEGKSEKSYTIFGDVTLDQTINIQDVNLLTNRIVEDFSYLYLNDVNNDFNVDISDVISVINVPVKFKNRSSPNIVRVDRKMQIDSLPPFWMFNYNFKMNQDSMIFYSKNFENEVRKFNIHFFSLNNNLTKLDSIDIMVNFYSPISDNVRLRYYKNFQNKDDFVEFSKNKIKRLNEPIFSTIITIPVDLFFSKSASIEVVYKNSKNHILRDLINSNKAQSDLVSEKLKKIPIIILATILGIMVIFIMILITKEFVRHNQKRS